MEAAQADSVEKRLLPYEDMFVRDMNNFKNGLFVMGRGLNVPKLIALYLSQFRFPKSSNPLESAQFQQTSPFLIFLLNFSDDDFTALEHYYKEHQGTLPIYRVQSSDSAVSTKRLDLYLKGGIFLVTFKILVLDLLTKRLSPSIISGVIINDAHKSSGKVKTGESFIAEILKKGNQEAFVKCFSDKPWALGRGGPQGMETLMKGIQVDNLVLFPRIKKCVKDSLDESKGLITRQKSIKFSKREELIHGCLIELLSNVVQELASQVRKLEQTQTISGISGNIDEVIDVKKALLKSFQGQFRGLLGRGFNFIGQKTRSLLRNIGEIKRLMWLLINADPVSFHTYLADLRFNQLQDEQSQSLYSIFTFCDEDTMKVIDRLFKLSKDRIYTLTLFTEVTDEFTQAELLDQTIERMYPKLSGRYQGQWLHFKDRIEKNSQDLDRFRQDYSFHLKYEPSPKMETIIKILKEAEAKFEQTEFYKSQYAQMSIKRFKAASEEEKVQEAVRESQNKNVMIVVKSQKMQFDLQRYIYSYFTLNDKGIGLQEDKLRYYLQSHREQQKREHLATSQQTCTQNTIEQYYLHSLALQLDQKRQTQIQKIEGAYASKKRGRNEISDEAQQPFFDFEYKPNSLINGYNIYCEFFNPQESTTFELALRKLKPAIILMYEPHLDFIRSIEVWNSERQLQDQKLDDVTLHLLMYTESTEFYQYMQTVDQEKLGFMKLIELKDKVNVELRNYKLEKQARDMTRVEQVNQSSTRQGGKPQQAAYESLEQDMLNREIAVVDSREFSCMTPIHMYEKGFWLVPMVLTVGDYVLSDDICIERKSVVTGDLFESFKSGRLLSQITNMCRFYKKPILLIEFDESVPFKLYDGQNESTMGGDVNPQSIISKISLLTLHFPLLQIMWSKGPQHTAELFKELRRQTSSFLGGISVKDPDLSRIAKIGTVGESGDADVGLEEQKDDSDDYKKYLPLEFLKKLPGVDSNNVGKLTKAAHTITDLNLMTEEELQKVVSTKSAKDIKSFLEKKVETLKLLPDDNDDL
ncbi:hypothetical protein FGO68_gene6330 [Halteria grandinella]|uniref:ERCC4 domain-containing protein n=1 Tax=Halteria grandinella TaxID=5974 RepID=A0A8J8T7W5_HALGN|nr:hypothetical protein FGO68_gene6330 [Halteria grandinella]